MHPAIATIGLDIHPIWLGRLGILCSHRVNNEDTFKNVMILRLILDFAGYRDHSLVLSGNRPIVLIHNAVITAVITFSPAMCLGKDLELRSHRFQNDPIYINFMILSSGRAIDSASVQIA